METSGVNLILHRKALDKRERKPELIRLAEQKLAKPLGVLNDHLADKDALVAHLITVADINMAGVLSYARRKAETAQH